MEPIFPLLFRTRLVAFLAGGAVFVWGWRLFAGRVPHGSPWGVRIPETLAEPAAWHAAGRRLGPWAMLLGLSIAAAGLFLDRLGPWAVLPGALIAFAFPLALASAVRAARRTYRTLHDAPPRKTAGGQYLPPGDREREEGR